MPGIYTAAITELRNIHDQLKKLEKDDLERYRRGFLEGRAFEITRQLDEHPNWWDLACCCGNCLSYGE